MKASSRIHRSLCDAIVTGKLTHEKLREVQDAAVLGVPENIKAMQAAIAVAEEKLLAEIEAHTKVPSGQDIASVVTRLCDAIHAGKLTPDELIEAQVAAIRGIPADINKMQIALHAAEEKLLADIEARDAAERKAP